MTVAVIVEKYGSPPGEPVRYDCLDSDAIAKGALLVKINGKSVSGGTLVLSAAVQNGDYPAAGIAAAEKVADDGQTSIAVLTNCLADIIMAVNKTCPAGALVKISGSDTIAPIVNAVSILSGCVLGSTVEAGVSGTATRVRVRT